MLILLCLRRENFGEFDYTTRGGETTAAIYRGVGNSEVRQMIQQYFPEMCTFHRAELGMLELTTEMAAYYGRTTIWGYLVGSSPIFELKDTEILVAAAITALGATRQARSHVKCSIQVGNSVESVAGMVETAREIAAWNKKPLPGQIDVGQLAEELERNLAANI